jgi:hypothetical protein
VKVENLKDRLELYWTQQPLVCAADVNLLDENMNTARKTLVLLGARQNVGLDKNKEKT